ncbi:PQQ-dependent sugar dehydrogenase [Halopiger djelfimassiliensis]|uniref:PQQ-dependent sugar dehydrogenase n=1 Tax=Halopiger djelfimassiliensis TaxID=1293047 RepID=UPI000677B0C4|nr:PQQ-dependent sugar dehydrogenase [Halopiger djelfimassiliensis]
MNPTNEPELDAATSRIGARSRRAILQALATSGVVAALGGVSAQEDETAENGDGIPVAGDFPEGETVGLQRVAANLPAPTDLEFVELDGEVRHFLATQTGQIYVTNLADGAADGETDASTDPAEDADEETPSDRDDGPSEFVFNGVVPGWLGLEPDEIDGRENPTLELTAGETYRFTWENGDGQPHNVVILDETDSIVERTEIVRELGETQTLEFEATEEMDRYVCEVHPGTMSGRIQVTDPDDEPAQPDDEVDEDVLTPDGMELFLDIEDRLVSLGIGELGGYDERGLLGLAFHPDFAENGRFFVRYSAPEREGLGYDHTDVLAEFRVDDDLTADPDSERTVMEVQQPQDNHNGGRIAFGPDGYLYTSLGDGGNVHDIGIGHGDDWYDDNEGGNGQNTSDTLLGGIHRIDVDSEDDAAFGEYGIPDDNPLVDSAADLDEYYAWGFRNPWGMSIDDDGQLFVADAGQHRVESVYAVEEGGNYSWNVKEGSFCFSPASPLEPPETCPDQVGEGAGEARAGEPLRDPIAEYQHTRISEAFIDSSVVTGGHRYAGDAIPELEGAFVFGNWSSQGVAEADGEVLTAVEPETGDAGGNDDLVGVDERWSLAELQFEGAAGESLNRYVYSVERDEAGELYVLANTDFRPEPETGEVYRIVPAEDGEEIPEPEAPHVIGDGDRGEAPDEESPEEERPDDRDDDDEAFPQDEDNGNATTDGGDGENATDPVDG